MEKMQFKAESQRLLDMMINSIYTNREIFMREIISNASDAIDKRYYREAEDGCTGKSRDDFEIRIAADKAARTLTISDDGIGMNKEELENNLGIIANSGSLKFKSDNSEALQDVDIIGQFGVGFYSAFMVAKKIQVISKAYGSTQAYIWESEGAEGFTIAEAERADVGTDIIIYLRDDTEDDNYSEFLEEYRIRSIVKQYSDYIRYPIVMNVTKQRQKPASEEEMSAEDYKPEYETFNEDEKLNSMVPLWKTKKSEITDEQYNDFFKKTYMSWSDPLKVVHTNVEGVISYDALLFVPSEVPFNYYNKDFKPGLQLYSSGVLIMDKCEDLLPSYFGFISGLVDSPDLSLNISREMLQQDRQLRAIAQRLEKKLLQAFREMRDKEREKYEQFFENFGIQLKYGVYDNFGADKDKLIDLLLYYSGTTESMTTLSDYVSRMEANQKYIYYAAGESKGKIQMMPQMDLFKDKGYEVLYCTDNIDEFAFMAMREYEGKEFKNISDKDLGFEKTDAEIKAQEDKNEAAKDTLTAIKNALGDKVSSVILSTRLKNHPVCFATADGVSIEMEKILKAQAAMSGNKDLSGVEADKVLELNGDLPFFEAIKQAVDTGDDDKVSDYAHLLYDQALVLEGMPVEDPLAFGERICKLMK
jgi:molecular chaperone